MHCTFSLSFSLALYRSHARTHTHTHRLKCKRPDFKFRLLTTWVPSLPLKRQRMRERERELEILEIARELWGRLAFTCQGIKFWDSETKKNYFSLSQHEDVKIFRIFEKLRISLNENWNYFGLKSSTNFKISGLGRLKTENWIKYLEQVSVLNERRSSNLNFMHEAIIGGWLRKRKNKIF